MEYAEVLSFGAGTNSTALAIMAINDGWHGEIVFSDTGCEWSAMEMKRCTKCHIDKVVLEFGKNKTRPDGLQSQCKQCRSKYYIENREKILEGMSRNYYKNRAKKLEYARQYVQQNRAKVTQYKREYYLANVEKYHIAHVEYYKTHRQEIINRVLRWRKENPDKLRANARTSVHRRRARLSQSGGSHSMEEFEELCAKHGNRCLCCDESKPLTIDHIVPISRGGTNDIDNIQPLCLSCNCKKSDKIIDYRGQKDND